MTRTSIREYVEAVRCRYLRASKIEKGKILDEFTQVVGCHRKAAIRLLRRENQAKAKRKRGRPQQYGITVAEALRVAWETTDRLCSKRLHPFLPELIEVLRRHGERTITAEVEAQLCRMSPSTIDRLLKSWRRVGGRRPFTTTKPGSLLKNSIPIRTWHAPTKDTTSYVSSGFLQPWTRSIALWQWDSPVTSAANKGAVISF
jgi:hypothetical protein